MTHISNSYGHLICTLCGDNAQSDIQGFFCTSSEHPECPHKRLTVAVNVTHPEIVPHLGTPNMEEVPGLTETVQTPPGQVPTPKAKSK